MMKMVRLKSITQLKWLALLIILVLCSSCTVQNEGYQHVVGVSLNQINDIWNSEFCSALLLNSKSDETINFVFMDAAGDVIRQKQDIEKLMDMEVDALIIVPENIDFLEDILYEAIDHECIVGIVGKLVQDEEIYTFNVYPDNPRIGFLAGQYMADKLDGSGHILEVLGEEDLLKTQEITAGFREALQNHEGIKVPYVLVGKDSRDTVKERVVEIFLKEPFTDAVFAHSDAMAWGARIALDNLGQTALVVGVGWGNKADAKALIDKGAIDAAVYISTGASETFAQIQKAINGQDVTKKIKIQPVVIH